MVKGPSASFAWLSTYYRDKYSIGIQLRWKAWRLNLKLNDYLISVWISKQESRNEKEKEKRKVNQEWS